LPELQDVNDENVKLIHDCCPYFHQQPKQKTDNIMSLLLTNECIITGCGYKCCEYETDSDLPSEDRRILVTLWVNNELIPEMKRVFPSQESLYQQMLVFVKSPLADYSDMHRSKAFMGREFIQYYEKNMTKPNRRVT
jgi:hypothetical protein